MRSFTGWIQTLSKSALRSRRHDLVMGCAAGYSVDAVRPFVESLLSAGAFVGKAVIFTRPSDTALIEYLEDRGVESARFETCDYPIANLYMARYFAYARYLRAQVAAGARYRCIFLSDVRDVTFQTPLFSRPCRRLELYYETPTTRIGEESWNSDWIRREFGTEVLTRLTGRRVSCSGTVSGWTAGILAYLGKMQSVMMRLPDDIKAGMRGDQAVHNYVLHTNMIPEALVVENFKRIATLHFVEGEHLHVDAAGRIANPDGSMSEVAHQWDRHPHLASAIAKKYGAA